MSGRKDSDFEIEAAQQRRNECLWRLATARRRLQSLGEELKYLTVTSRATVHAAAGEAEEGVVAQASVHPKCERCWHYRADVGVDPAHPGLCGRCADNLFGAGETRRFV